MNSGMNVTSMLSQGYLLPSRKALDAIKKQGEAASLALREQQILAQERALKAKSTDSKVSTVYHYSIGPNGRRYITGAEVTIEGDEQAVDQVPGGVKHESIRSEGNRPEGNEPHELDPKTEEAEKTGKNTPVSRELQDPEREAVQELKRIEQEVIAHEAAHQAAGGRFAGAVSYSYTQGPDGKRYITGGEVPIHVPASDDPEQTLRDMEQVRRAALAPGNPSGQDLSVAAAAAAIAAQARQQLALSKAKEAGSGEFKTGAASVQAGLRFEDIQSGNIQSGNIQSEIQSQRSQRSRQSQGRAEESLSETRDPAEVYARHASKYGLWAWGRGFEPVASEQAASKGVTSQGVVLDDLEGIQLPFDFAA
jgi:hypothetical protein